MTENNMIQGEGGKGGGGSNILTVKQGERQFYTAYLTFLTYDTFYLKGKGKALLFYNGNTAKLEASTLIVDI